MTEPRNCPDCAAVPGEQHKPGCDVERCAICGDQLISCDCVYVVNGLDPDTLEFEHPDIYHGGSTDEMLAAYEAEVEKLGGPLLWTGEWPGEAECREFGFWSYWGPPWIACKADHPGAGPGLNELYTYTKWDKVQRKRVPVESYERYMARLDSVWRRLEIARQERAMDELAGVTSERPI